MIDCKGKGLEFKDCGPGDCCSKWLACMIDCKGKSLEFKDCGPGDCCSKWLACMIDCKGNSLEFKDYGPGDCCSKWLVCMIDCKGRSLEFKECGPGDCCSKWLACMIDCKGKGLEFKDCGPGDCCSKWLACMIDCKGRSLEIVAGRSLEFKDCGPGDCCSKWLACMIDCKGRSLEFKECGPGDCCREEPGDCCSKWLACMIDCKGKGLEFKDCGPGDCCSKWFACMIDCKGKGLVIVVVSSKWLACMIDCKGKGLEFKDCGPGDCCKERVWSAWGEWTNCTNDSKHPTHTRWRACEADQIHIDKPMCPQPCFGGNHQVETCCHVSWGEWSPWTQCTSTIGYKDPDTNKDCGSGCRNRIIFFIPSWTAWTPWDECPQTNRAEVQSRHRWCQLSRGDLGSPACQLHGCFNSRNSSEDQQTQPCLNTCNPCVNPAWNIWSQWSLCEFQSDGTIRRTKSRTCYAPSDSQPNCQHLTCVGPDIGSELCKCDTGTWSDWSEWGNCEKQGYETIQRKKTRLCFADSNPSDCPKIYCDGDYEEKENCCEGIIWKEWGAWSHCLYGSPPYRTRTRECHVPAKNLQNPKCLKTCENWTERKDCTLTTSKSCTQGEWENIRDPCDCATNKSRSYQLRVKSSYEDQNLPLCSPTTRNNSSRDCSDQCVAGCNETCQGKTDGKYPSCRKGCNHYVMCCENTPLVSKCNGGQQYNSVCRKCVLENLPPVTMMAMISISTMPALTIPNLSTAVIN
ncbi:A disintegrin and metalloproteinase with thrombospondin motifs adt-1-like [Physella acuta]|uniref:A disintegrin and metalloproteinase with thrombospondin motifs adt-1-like n=1 Tax=Physella acuta TaxID=109671 RepID=UPI0027DCC866|nr:A disintegrin and metalloproteinase with thrombospondin motifs adt-1-like [Physella acuta]